MLIANAYPKLDVILFNAITVRPFHYFRMEVKWVNQFTIISKSVREKQLFLKGILTLLLQFVVR